VSLAPLVVRADEIRSIGGSEEMFAVMNGYTGDPSQPFLFACPGKLAGEIKLSFAKPSANFRCSLWVNQAKLDD
jgi:hypothetical protein